MTSDDYNTVDQAVFGYSNGHRLLRSSITLTPVDLYELAATSDLAPGARLTSSVESYLTGAILPESKRYALVRTWLAPEMPRPGCVWSHVLLLPRSVLSSQIDLSTFNSLFRRPADYETNDLYSSQIDVLRRGKGDRAQVEPVERLLSAIYLRHPLDWTACSIQEWERAILSIWSQQWPKLRSQFVFRSVFSTNSLRNQAFNFDQTAGNVNPNFRPKWLDYAIQDANSTSVTPLRRFLWRYGKDIDKPQEAFADLVDIFVVSNDPETFHTLADRIFSRFGPGQAETLKSDLFGLGVSSVALVPNVGPAEVIRLVGRYNETHLDDGKRSLAGLFKDLAPEQVPEVAAAILAHEDELGALADDILKAIISSATVESVSADLFPHEYLYQALLLRPELIVYPALERLSEGELYSLCFEVPNANLQEVLKAILARGCDPQLNPPIFQLLVYVLPIAVDLFQRDQLGEGWQQALSNKGGDVLPYLHYLTDSQAVAAFARLLSYPVDSNNSASLWLDGIRKGHLDRSEETKMLTYIFVLCIVNGLRNNIEVLKSVLPELRSRNLAGELSRQSQELLGRWLPSHHQSWDLDRRILKLIRQVYKDGGNLDDLVRLLGLSDKSFIYATNRAKDDSGDPFKPFQPWSWFS